MPIISSVLTGIYVIVVLVLLFGLTIFVHELGHFLAALRFGMVIDVFSIGFGPAIWKKKIRGITYKISWIPLGGYVALPQLDPTGMSSVQGAEDKDGEKKTDEPPPRELPHISPWKKIVVSLAGATGNIILAFVFAWIIFFNPNSEPPEANTLVGYISTNSVAYAEGIRVGDEVLSVSGESVDTWTEIMVNCTLLASTNDAISITVQSKGSERDILVPLHIDGYDTRRLKGILPSFYCMVTNVGAGSPAEQAGIKSKDMIKTFDGIRVASVGHLLSLVAKRPDQNVPIILNRKGKDVPVTVTLSSAPEEEASPLYAQVQAVLEDNPAGRAGVKAGDVIKAIDGTTVMSAEHLRELIATRADQATELTIERKSGDISLTVTPQMNEELERAVIGIMPTDYLTAVERLGLKIVEADSGVPQWMIYKQPSRQIKSDFKWIFRTLRGFVSKRPGEAKQVAKGIAGPARILVLLWFSIQAGLLNAVGFIRFLNINLAVINLLPIPVLDGGHIVFCLIEGITRRKLHPRIVNSLINAFAVLLIGAVLLVTFLDFKGLPKFLRQLRGKPPAEKKVEKKPAPEENVTAPEKDE